MGVCVHVCACVFTYHTDIKNVYTYVYIDGACTKEDLITALDECSPDLFKKIESKLATDKDDFSLFNIISALGSDDWTYFCNEV